MAQKRYDVVVVGELNIDLILNKLEKFPEIGKEVISHEMQQTLGSSSAIFANNLSVLGAKVSFIGKVGDDGYAAQIREALQSGGVYIDHLLTTNDNNTGITVAFNFENDRAMVTYPGAMNDLSVNDISDEVLGESKHLHVSSIFLQEGLKIGVVDLFKRAKSLGLTTSLDPQWDPEEKWDVDLNALLPYVDVFLPNEAEIQNLTKTNSVEEAINTINAFSNYVVVKCGTEGALAWDKSAIIKQKPYLNENVVDAIGAGDSFDAGFISKYIQSKEFYECLDFASLVGAVNTTAAGGTGAFKSLSAVEQCIDEFPKK